jgi:putative spermidine/putrescine transport system permease protein
MILLAALVTPWLVSDMLRAFGWQQLLSPVGPLASVLTVFGGDGYGEGLRFNFAATAVALIGGLLPAGILTVFVAIPSRTRTEWLAARELGTSSYVLKTMVLGRARPGIIIGAAGVFVLACFASAEPRFLDGPTQTRCDGSACAWGTG